MAGTKQPLPTDIYVGSRIRLRRKILGMSQEKLGDRLGITFQQIQKYEKGTNRVGASRLQAMSDALEVPVSFFFKDQAERSNGSGADEMADFLSADALELLRVYHRIEAPGVRRKVMELVRTMAAA